MIMHNQDHGDEFKLMIYTRRSYKFKKKNLFIVYITSICLLITHFVLLIYFLAR